ncbi:methyltransferase domain-containing protein [Pseudolabrys taiwanensis]|uniref:Methyltransferase domain-containing protein n=1 Tax=Pseudolabrys taiwanensis TaxID=331696 RepID=A0A345ZQI6_9HYPH|nr:methyltransferase domain-containing protein [Pseudolabrys taiwanensis]AXK79183.1 methyltransferase domain-containing protein [Pseudolabrys taiwanensis]
MQEFKYEGFCPICDHLATFHSHSSRWWDFRAGLVCKTCPGGSLPRERAIAFVMKRLCPDWRAKRVHESSPAERGLSVVLAKECAGYIPTQYFPNEPLGKTIGKFRCENLEKQTFADCLFDIVITQDVYEHILDPIRATAEIFRTLVPGGLSILTTGVFKQHVKSVFQARHGRDGDIEYLKKPPEYHGNPISSKGSLVTASYGHDFPELLAKWAPFDVELFRFVDREHGILGEFTDVIVCRKPRYACQLTWET